MMNRRPSVLNATCAVTTSLSLLAAGLPALADPSLTMTEMFLENCLGPLERGEGVATEGLTPLGPDIARQLSQHSTGEAWVSTTAHVSVVPLRVGPFVGCQVQYHFGAASRSLTVDQRLNQGVFLAFIKAWIVQAVETGRYEQLFKCETEDQFQSALDSRYARSTPIRIVVDSDQQAPHLFIIAAETTTGAPFEACE